MRQLLHIERTLSWCMASLSSLYRHSRWTTNSLSLSLSLRSIQLGVVSISARELIPKKVNCSRKIIWYYDIMPLQWAPIKEVNQTIRCNSRPQCNTSHGSPLVCCQSMNPQRIFHFLPSCLHADCRVSGSRMKLAHPHMPCPALVHGTKL